MRAGIVNARTPLGEPALHLVPKPVRELVHNAVANCCCDPVSDDLADGGLLVRRKRVEGGRRFGKPLPNPFAYFGRESVLDDDADGSPLLGSKHGRTGGFHVFRPYVCRLVRKPVGKPCAHLGGNPLSDRVADNRLLFGRERVQGVNTFGQPLRDPLADLVGEPISDNVADGGSLFGAE